MTVMITFMITARTTIVMTVMAFIMMTAITSLPSHASYVESVSGSSSAHLCPPPSCSCPQLLFWQNTPPARTASYTRHQYGGRGWYLEKPRAAAAESMFNQTFCWTPLPRPAPHPHISRVIRPFTITFTYTPLGWQPVATDFSLDAFHVTVLNQQFDAFGCSGPIFT